jgi:ABC-2 type transport system ATP-binding protein
MLEVRDLTKTFAPRKKSREVHAVRSIDFAIPSGETFGLLGPNGAGKTTTVRMLAGLLRPTAGEIRFREEAHAFVPASMRALTGMVNESGGIYDRLTSLEYLGFFGRIFGLSPGEVERRASDLLARFELADVGRRRIGTFSKGMKQKLNLARALLHGPQLLLLDEPTSGLDPAMTEIFWEVLADLREQRELITILCTHNLDEADRLCDRVAILMNGRIVKEGTPDRLRGEGEERILRVRLAEVTETLLEAVRGVEGAVSAEAEGDVIRVYTDQPASIFNPAVARTVVEAGGELVALEEETGSLKDIYLKIVRGGGGA